MAYKAVKNIATPTKSPHAVTHISPFPEQQRRDVQQARRHDNDMKKLERLAQRGQK